MNSAIFLYILIFIFAAYKGYEFLKQYSSAPQTIIGKIIDKDYHLERKRILGRSIIKARYWLVFETEQQHRLTLFCDGNDYERFLIGDVGRIKYSSEMLLKFIKEDEINVQ